MQAINSVPPDALAIAATLRYEASDLILFTSVSETINQNDVIPTAIRDAGGSVAHFGVPVDPGSLLVLGYIGKTPVLGVSGCVKSLQSNVVELIPPRLLASERLTRADLVAMGYGVCKTSVKDQYPANPHKFVQSI